MTPFDRQSVIVLGAGPAGLTAAYRLAHRGLHVTIVEQSPELAEPLRTERDSPVSILGCHQTTWNLLQSCGIQRSHAAFAESSLEFLLSDGRLARYPRSRFPRPFQQLLSIGRFAGLSWQERWTLLSWLEQIWDGSLVLGQDLEQRNAENWLQSVFPNRSSLQTVCGCLARWLTGNALQHLSADAFIMALKPFLLAEASNSRIWVSREPWARVFVTPIVKSIETAGSAFRLGSRATRFEYHEDRISGLRLTDGTALQADWYVAAVAAQQLTPLLPERWLTRYAYFQHIVDLATIPFEVIQVRTTWVIDKPRHILIGTGPFSWLVAMPSESDGSLVTVLTMPQDRSVTDTEQQATALLRSLNLLRRDHPLTAFRQEETARAWLALPPGTKLQRPMQRSPITNLLLAGAWTDTGWPANVESAIVSGERCADIIIGQK